MSSYQILVEKAVGRIVVRGQSDDILNVSGAIHKILHQLREEEHERKRADIQDIQWMYRCLFVCCLLFVVFFLVFYFVFLYLFCLCFVFCFCCYCLWFLIRTLSVIITCDVRVNSARLQLISGSCLFRLTLCDGFL